MDMFSGGHGGLKGSAAKWVIVSILAVIAACLLIETSAATQPAQAQSIGVARSASIFALGGQITKDNFGIYLVDPENGTITVYQWSPGERKLELLASRNISYDRMLDDYNTKPSPREVRDLVEMHKRLDSKKIGEPSSAMSAAEAKDRADKSEPASGPTSRP